MSSAFPLSSPIEVEGTGGTPGQIELSDGTNAVQVRAPTGLAGNVDFTLPATAGTTGYFLQRSGATATAWAEVIQNNPSSSLPLSTRFNDSNGAPTSTTSTTFVTEASMVYRGTVIDNPILQILVIVETTNNNASGQVQIFDYTNSQIIATSAVYGPAGGGGLTKFILDLGTISNLPTGQVILEIQLRRVNTNGGGATAIYSCEMYG